MPQSKSRQNGWITNRGGKEGKNIFGLPLNRALKNDLFNLFKNLPPGFSPSREAFRVVLLAP